MRLIANGTQVPTPDAPAAVVGTPGYGTDGSPVAGSQASIFDNDTCNSILLELMTPLLALGLAADPTNNGQHLSSLRTIFGAKLQTFTANGTCTVPPGKTQALVLQWAGGAGGGGSNGADAAASGGGGGEWRLALVTGLTGGQAIPVSIGAGGTPGQNTSSPTNGGDGGDTTFGGYITCKGGKGGLQALNGVQTTAGGLGGTNGTFGLGAVGLAIGGYGGGLGQAFGSVYAGGQGGAATMSSNGQMSIASNGVPGVFPAGGGNGGAAGGLGGAGAGGLCIALFV